MFLPSFLPALLLDLCLFDSVFFFWCNFIFFLMHVYFFEAFPWMSGGSCKYTASSLLISKQINWGWHMLPDTPRLQTQHLTEGNIQYLTPLQHSLSTMDFRTNSLPSLPFKGSKFMCGTGWHRLNYQAFQILLIQKDFPGSADRDLKNPGRDGCICGGF